MPSSGWPVRTSSNAPAPGRISSSRRTSFATTRRCSARRSTTLPTMNNPPEGTCRQILPTPPPRSIDCCVTSPPYYLLRKYLPKDAPGSQFELGREATPEEYVQNLVGVFRLVWRVLCDDGTLW